MNTITNSRLSTKITPLAAAILMATATASHAVVTLNFADNASDGVQGTDFNFTCNTTNMTAGNEFRMCAPDGSIGGGVPPQKDMIVGGEQWMFSGSTTGLMTGVAGTANTGGLTPTTTYYIDMGYVDPSADRDGGPGMDQGALFFSQSFGFLAPFVGSEANTNATPHPNDVAWNVPLYEATSDSTFTILFPVAEAQWAGAHFTIGRTSGGVLFQGTTDGTNFSMWAEKVIATDEDEASAGFAGWTPQWYYTGTITGFVPLNAAIGPILDPASPGALSAGFTGTFADGRVTRAEIDANFASDTEAVSYCLGTCFDYSVTGLAGDGSDSAIVILSLPSGIPDQEVLTYRKYDGTNWITFDTTSGSDTVESSGAGQAPPVDCTGVTGWTAGLTPGDKCVRLTIADNGPNDLNPANGTIDDPGGVAVIPPDVICETGYIPAETGGNCVVPGQDLDFGCSVTDKPVNPLHRADWWLLAAFLSVLGIRKYRKQKA